MGVKSRIRNIDKELKGWMSIMAHSIKDAFDQLEKRIAELEKKQNGEKETINV